MCFSRMGLIDLICADLCWAQWVPPQGAQLAKIRMYKPQSATPRIIVFVPPEDGSGGGGDGDITN